MSEPRWLDRALVDTLHELLIREFGGTPGVRDPGLIESALARPLRRYEYAQPDLADLAAAYCYGLARNHGYLDGNKRIAATAMGVFADLNGHEIIATEAELVDVMLAVASGECTEEELAGWVRGKVEASPEPADGGRTQPDPSG